MAKRTVAAALGVMYKLTPSGGFSHSNVITILDADGEIIHQQSGLGTDPTLTLIAIREQAAADR